MVGIVLGLGIGFMLEGIRWMSDGWLIAAIGLLGTLLLLSNKAVPAMFLLLLFGAACGAYQHPEILHALFGARISFHLPRVTLLTLSWHDLIIGTAFLALPQLPLTLGNAVIAIREENNRLFPERLVTENGRRDVNWPREPGECRFWRRPNVPRGGGMAGHVAFGARTGGAPIILGSILLCLAVFLSGSIQAVFGLIAQPVLGVILFLTGAQLALGSCDFSKDKGERFITLATAAFALWNVGLAFVVGILLHQIARRGWLRALAHVRQLFCPAPASDRRSGAVGHRPPIHSGQP
ncbi:MAG: putative sulfate/molybdate transporter [Steroidobacteraceae bacterium]